MDNFVISVTETISIKIDSKDTKLIQDAKLRYQVNGTKGKVLIKLDGKILRLCRYLVDAIKGDCVVFLNGDHLDFRRQNLLKCDKKTCGELSANNKRTKSGYIGVHQNIASGHYIAKIKCNKISYVESFEFLEDAAFVADYLTIKFSSHRRRNFPEYSDQDIFEKYNSILNCVGTSKYEKRVKLQQGKSKGGQSDFVGVYFDKRRKKNPWYSKIQNCEKSTYLGSYETEYDAALAYNEKALELYGNGARVNKL